MTDLHIDLQSLIKRNGVSIQPNSNIPTARDRIQSVRRRNTKSHTDSKYKFVCQKCNKQYANKYSKEARNHAENCNYGQKQLENKKKIENINSAAFHEEIAIATAEDVGLKESNIVDVSNESDSDSSCILDDPLPLFSEELKKSKTAPQTKQNDSECNAENLTSDDDLEILSEKVGLKFDTFSDPSSNITNFPPTGISYQNSNNHRLARIIDLLGDKKSYMLQNWLEENGFKVKNDIHKNLQVGVSCGYVAAKAVFLLNEAGSKWWELDMINQLSGSAAKALISNGNKYLNKHTSSSVFLYAEEIWELIGKYCEEKGNPKQLMHSYLNDGPLSFDYFLPKLVEIVKQSNRGLGTEGLKTFIFNTENSNKDGFHWISLIIEVKS